MTNCDELLEESNWFQEEQEVVGKLGLITIDSEGWPLLEDPGIGRRKLYLNQLASTFEAKRRAVQLRHSQLSDRVEELTERVSQLTQAGETILQDHQSLAE